MDPKGMEAVIVLVASFWGFYLWASRGGVLPLFYALYLLPPAAGLAAESLHLVDLVEPVQWAAVAGNAILTVGMILETWRDGSRVSMALRAADLRMRTAGVVERTNQIERSAHGTG